MLSFPAVSTGNGAAIAMMIIEDSDSASATTTERIAAAASNSPHSPILTALASLDFAVAFTFGISACVVLGMGVYSIQAGAL